MIQPLRSAHRVAFNVLAVVLPTLVLAGLFARHPARESATKPSISGAYFQSTNGTVKLGVDGRTLTVISTDKFNFPETLVYTSAHKTVDAEAMLLGPLNADGLNEFQLPESKETSRFVIFYSPALSSVVDSAEFTGVR